MSVLKIKDASGNWQDIPTIKGSDATINGLNTLNIVGGTNIDIDQEGTTLTINSTGGSGEWGSITGDISDQTDLYTVLSQKAEKEELAAIKLTGTRENPIILNNLEKGFYILDGDGMYSINDQDQEGAHYTWFNNDAVYVLVHQEYYDESHRTILLRSRYNDDFPDRILYLEIVSDFPNDDGEFYEDVKVITENDLSNLDRLIDHAVYNILDQAVSDNYLLSSDNVKTINNQSIIGSGNIEIEGSWYTTLSESSYNIDNFSTGWYKAETDSVIYLFFNERNIFIGVDNNGMRNGDLMHIQSDSSRLIINVYGQSGIYIIMCIRDSSDIYATQYVLKEEVLTKRNNEEYTPSSNYHPATKKYVDDSTNNVLSQIEQAVADNIILSSTNVKTINNQSIVGTGNIEIESGVPNVVIRPYLSGYRYDEGMIVIKDGVLYQAMRDIPYDEEFNPDHWSDIVPSLSDIVSHLCYEIDNLDAPIYESRFYRGDNETTEFGFTYSYGTFTGKVPNVNVFYVADLNNNECELVLVNTKITFNHNGIYIGVELDDPLSENEGLCIAVTFIEEGGEPI